MTSLEHNAKGMSGREAYCIIDIARSPRCLIEVASKFAFNFISAVKDIVGLHSKSCFMKKGCSINVRDC